MRVVSVQMRDFRSYARADAVLGEGLTVVHGPNGAGKSNLLEAIYFGCTARSPRTRNERELVLKLISPLRPGLIESPDSGDFVYLIMPIRLNV